MQIKKARALGIDIVSLSKQDILFINPLTIGDIAKSGDKYDISISPHSMDDVASIIKSMEKSHRKKMFGRVELEGFA